MRIYFSRIGSYLVADFILFDHTFELRLIPESEVSNLADVDNWQSTPMETSRASLLFWSKDYGDKIRQTPNTLIFGNCESLLSWSGEDGPYCYDVHTEQFRRYRYFSVDDKEQSSATLLYDIDYVLK